MDTVPETTTQPPEPTEVHADLGGERRVYRFDNGYGASVVRTLYSYGGGAGLFELAVLDQDGRLCYDTPITSDVEGWLTEPNVETLLRRISALPKPSRRVTRQMLTQREQDVAIVHKLIAATFPESDERLGAMRMRAVIELVLVYAEEAHRARTEAGL